MMEEAKEFIKSCYSSKVSVRVPLLETLVEAVKAKGERF